ncbi:MULTISPECIES: pyridoxal phosphate-dependent aminotransferase [Pseudomonas syringae group]|uniref:pyridoxal phosphate-dependent aminotransferase n=1 Tax=Pseudomonas syringae group TaxID=136849 RepID=UPI0002097620|nr:MULTISPECIES: pyridoxal phosphate-dependent aminotransferase [Pseudomonas syringae group]KPC09790.1 Aspartate aminotransferase [Pseudomonas amygdali pv. lachrymans]EGH99044.1 aspartate aminotransferase [Pseudomonas amygdali pv. lachrymans str. M302278]KPB98598.1 Aspartate aminotransferase [Pseudomonas syringae pv. maculicola str. M6]KPX75706.1 Aspartate aminotransferase [Pseudomonas syringae pv. maculicola]QQN29726.1 pyridoxal phosphate-dependent aminotransferase [Pseudomonas syringae pv. m
MSILLPPPSPILAMAKRAAERKAAGHDVIDLTLGEPDFSAPQHVIAVVHAALDARTLGYSPANGLPELRNAIRNAFERDRGLAYTDDEITVGCGAKQIIFNAFLASIEPGDEVIIPAPYWASYPDMVAACGGKPVIINCPLMNNFRLSPEQLKAAITARTRWLIINAPGNPSGVTYSAEDLQALGDVLLKHPHVMIMSDDIYAHIHFANRTEHFQSLIAVVPQLRERILTVDGVSKAYAMTGWRVGWGAGPRALIKSMIAIQSQNCTQTASLSQIAAAVALNGPQECLKVRNEIYRQRRDAALSILKSSTLLAVNRPDGAFYLFPKLIGAHNDGDSAANVLLEEYNVAVVPGSAFGVPDALRLSFATEEKVLIEGCKRIVDFISKAHK